MRLVPLFRWIATATIVAGMASQVLPCKCSQRFYIGKTFWQAAQLRSEGPTVIFEGTLAKVQVRWNALDAKDGEMYSANPEEKNPGDKQVPHLIVTFRVQRAYQGILGPEVQVRTGLGGGDCGARFAPGLIYLVYASKLSDGELGVSTCSPGGWVGNESVQVDLRYLRKERPTNSDLEPWRPWSATKPTNLEQRKTEEFKKHYASLTGKICGKVVRQNVSAPVSGAVYFLSTLGHSPMDLPVVMVHEDGSFCSDLLGPGKYFLYFQTYLDDKHFSAVYYLSAIEKAQATPIEVSPGQTQSDIRLSAPTQETYSVRGIISTNEKPPKGEPGGVSVALIPLDGGPMTTYRWQTVQAVFPVANAEYFHFENVPPGRYAAFAQIYGDKWFTERVDVTVTNHSKFIFVKLTHNR